MKTLSFIGLYILLLIAACDNKEHSTTEETTVTKTETVHENENPEPAPAPAEEKGTTVNVGSDGVSVDSKKIDVKVKEDSTNVEIRRKKRE